MKVDQAIIKNFCVSGWKCSRYYTVSYYLSLSLFGLPILTITIYLFLVIKIINILSHIMFHFGVFVSLQNLFKCLK